ncbi:MAG TPA: nucleoside-diphosphate kinase [Thermomicrobiales bacterium]|nr:nucleoside-diphosphate kinase [Thermomicrobiales bacterium]
MADTEQTLIIVKPDGVQRGLVGEIVGRLERRGLKIVAMQMQEVSRETAERHYAEHEGKPFFAGLVDYITSAPVVVMVLEGPQAVAAARSTIGSTKPVEATPGTIRGDLGMMVGRNLVHGSDSPESGKREIGIFFGDSATYGYARDMDRWILE